MNRKAIDKRIKKAQVHLALLPDLLTQVRDAALKDGRTVTNWIEQSIKEKLSK